MTLRIRQEDNIFASVTSRSRAWLTAFGIVMVLAGLGAIAFPLTSSLGVEICVGIMFVIVGIAQSLIAFRSPKWFDLILGLIGLAWLLAGIFLLMKPMEGIAILTIVVTASLLFEGLLKVFFAFLMRSIVGWGWILFDGLLALILGVLLWIQFPTSALWALGTLAGINILFSGLTLIMLASAVGKLVQTHSLANIAI